MNAGYRLVEVNDAVQGASIAVRFLYPTKAEERMEPFGPFVLPIAPDAPIEGKELPLVVVSHGTGGTPFTHRNLAAHLAREGFVVAMVQHPGNHRGDDSLSGKAINLQNRPRHIRLVIDAAFADEVIGPRLSTKGVSVIGHSMGGYTALAVAGGNPSCFPWETPDGSMGPVEVEHDARVRALVLLAPATPWFGAEGALSRVDVPILMLNAERDVLVEPVFAQLVELGLPDRSRLEHRVVPGAGHFAFLSPYPAAMKNPAIAPSQDPEGFDREAYEPIFFRDVVTFLRANG